MPKILALALAAMGALAAESLVSEGAQPVVARLDMEVAREGKPAEECAIVTRSGHEGEFKKVTEYIYPTNSVRPAKGYFDTPDTVR